MPTVDGLDAAIFRVMFPSGEWSLSGVDPLLSPAEIGQRVGRSANTVRRRLARWRSDGFLRGFSALPNPVLLGLTVHLHLLSVDGLDRCDGFERELALLETPAFVYRIGTSYAVLGISRGTHTQARDHERFRRLPHLRVVNDPISISFPPPARTMRRADWQLIRALRAEPSADPRSLCLREGGSARSCHRRLASWLEGNLVFFLPVVDFEHARGTVAWIGSVLDPKWDSGVIDQAVARAFPDRIRIQNISPMERLLPLTPGEDRSVSFQFLLPAGSAQAAEVAYARFCHIPGVRQCLLAFPTRNYSLSSVIDDAIAEALELAGPTKERTAVEGTARAQFSAERLPPTSYPIGGIASIGPVDRFSATVGLPRTLPRRTSSPAPSSREGPDR